VAAACALLVVYLFNEYSKTNSSKKTFVKAVSLLN